LQFPAGPLSGPFQVQFLPARVLRASAASLRYGTCRARGWTEYQQTAQTARVRGR